MNRIPALPNRGSDRRSVSSDGSNVIRNLALITPLYFINQLGLPGNALFFAALIFLAFRSAESCIKALSLLYIVLVGNVALVSTAGPIFGIGRFVFLFLALAVLSNHLNRRGGALTGIPIFWPLFLFCLVAVLLALVDNYFLIISISKLISFALGVLCVFLGVEVMRGRAHDLNTWFLSLVIFVALIGLVAWLAGIGFNSKTELEFSTGLFNGPFYHPQTLGPAATLIIVWLAFFRTLTKHKMRDWVVLLIPVFLAFAYFSSSRTSLAALATSAGIVLLMALVMNQEMRRQLRPVLRYGALAGLALFVSAIVLETARPGSVVDSSIEFITKAEDADVSQLTAEQVTYSRQALVSMMVANIEKDPWTGIGFGTSTRPGFGSGGSILGSTTTEKGFLPVAIVEETGFIGAFFFAVFVFSVFAYLLRTENLPGLAGFAALIGINFGEMNFFSFGGQGGFFWMWVMALMIMGNSISKASRRQRESRRHKVLHSNAAA